MKIPGLILAAALSAGVGALALEKPPGPPGKPGKTGAQSGRQIQGWGKAVHPENDCGFFLSQGELLLHVPGGPPHDLAAEIGVTNAPRVLQPVRGDFVMQVKIEGRFAPGDQSTLPGRTGYNGAGLVLMGDEKNVVTLARAVLHRGGDAAVPYANFEMRADGRLQRIGMTGDHPLPKTEPVWLRLERRGQLVRGAVSLDGAKWTELEPKTLPDSFPLELQAGVVAISTSKEEFNPRYSQFQVLQ
jgi:regulation of enolase protein 1 (concanavalin A-like superfamily)